MDTDNLVNQIKKRFDHDSAKKILKEKYEAKLLFADQGGMWNASPELIVLLSSLNDENVVLLDMYETPCNVNREQLLIKVNQRFQEQMNRWHIEYQEVLRER